MNLAAFQCAGFAVNLLLKAHEETSIAPSGALPRFFRCADAVEVTVAYALYFIINWMDSLS